MLPSPAIDVKAFVPTKDHELSKAFYTDLGFTINWSNDEIAELQIGSFRFLLQKFYVAEHAGNFMMSLRSKMRTHGGNTSNAGSSQEVSWHHVQAAGDAAVGDTSALPERPNRCPLAHL